MIKREQIPKSSVENAVAAFTVEGATWEDVIAAAINVWPGVEVKIIYDGTEQIILPLTQENNNADG